MNTIVSIYLPIHLLEKLEADPEKKSLGSRNALVCKIIEAHYAAVKLEDGSELDVEEFLKRDLDPTAE